MPCAARFSPGERKAYEAFCAREKQRVIRMVMSAPYDTRGMMSYDEIAAKLGCSKQCVEFTEKTALFKLRAMLEDDEEELMAQVKER